MEKVDISLVDDLIDEKNAEIKRLVGVLELIESMTSSQCLYHSINKVAREALDH